MRLGIDFGTCLSSAAFIRNGLPTFVKEPLRHGYSFPTSVYLTPAGELLIGQAAENQRLVDPQRYLREFKRELGSNVPLFLGEQSWQPDQLAAFVLRKLKQEAELSLGTPDGIDGAVITIPADYQAHKRGLMTKAATTAGFRQVDLLEEPVAAALAYTRRSGNPLPEGTLVLVYDLGGGTFDAVLLKKSGASFVSIAAPQGLANCGGVDFDRAIYQHACTQYTAIAALTSSQRQDLETLRARAILADLCRDLKHQLSEADEAEKLLVLPGTAPELFRLNRAALARLIAPYLSETIALCRRVVESADATFEQIGGVLLVGGSCRIPAVQEAVAREFGRPVWRIEEPELAVCQGAAYHAALLEAPPTAGIRPLGGGATGQAQLVAMPRGNGAAPLPYPLSPPTPPAAGPLLGSLAGPQMSAVSTMAFTRDGAYLATGDLVGHLWLWELKTGQIVREFILPARPGQPLGRAVGVCALALDPGNQTLIAGYQDSAVRLWDLASGQLRFELPGHIALVRAVAIAPKGEYMASGSDDQSIIIWNIRRQQMLGALRGHTSAVMALAIAPDGTTLVSGSKDCTVRMWDLRTGQLIRILAGHTNVVRSVAISPNGQAIASCSDDGSIRLWDAKTGQALGTIQGHVGAVNRVVFSPDSLTLASGGSDQLIKLWQVRDGASLVGWQTGHQQWVRTIAFSPDGQMLASGGEDNAIKLWQTSLKPDDATGLSRFRLFRTGRQGT